MGKNILITGASRGLGAALAAGVPEIGDQLWLLSRNRPPICDANDGITRHWLEIDLVDPQMPQQLIDQLGDVDLDVCIYNAGIWESSAFSSSYSLDGTTQAENARVMQINSTAAIHCVQAILPHLRRAAAAKVIFIGSTSGLENTRAPEVAYGASKFAIRGVTHALRECLRPDNIPVSCINPGSIATGRPYTRGQNTVTHTAQLDSVPLEDLVLLVRCLLSLSNFSCVKEINVPATADPHV